MTSPRGDAGRLIGLPDVDRLVSTVGCWHDRIGVLSAYVGVEPSAEASRRPAWSIRLDADVAAIRERLLVEGRDEAEQALERRLDGLVTELARLADAVEHGRGRALFLAVDSGRVEAISVQARFATGATFSARPDLLPLLTVDEGAPVGLVVVGRDVVRVLQTRLGELAELATHDVEPVLVDGPERKGPAAANPLRALQVVAQRQRYERHVESGHRRLLAQAAHRLAVAAGENGWELAVVAGDPRGAGPLAEALRVAGVDVEPVDRNLESLAAAAALSELAPAVATQRSRRELELVERARAAALSGGPGALGLADTLTALAERRVDRLLIDPHLSITGALLPDGIVPPGAREAELRAEPSIAARLVADAIESGTRVTGVDGRAARALADAGGVGALLRW